MSPDLMLYQPGGCKFACFSSVAFHHLELPFWQSHGRWWLMSIQPQNHRAQGLLLYFEMAFSAQMQLALELMD